MDNTKIVMFGSDEAAKPVTMTGWLSRGGYFFHGVNAERDARKAGSTHGHCSDCGLVVTRYGWRCDKCQAKVERENYEQRPRQEWDGEGVLYSEAAQMFFNDWDDVQEFCEGAHDGETHAAESLLLVICEPRYARELDVEYFGDDLPEGEDLLPDDLQAAVNDFNAAVKHLKPLSWYPGKFAVALPDEFKAEGSEPKAASDVAELFSERGVR